MGSMLTSLSYVGRLWGMMFLLQSQIFFSQGKLLKQIKNTNIALVPKTEVAQRPGDFRPISLTNMIYKIVMRILASRMKEFMGKPIGFYPRLLHYGQYSPFA